MTWLHGGPFLELSFIIEEPSRIEDVLSKLGEIPVKIEVHSRTNPVLEVYLTLQNGISLE